MTPLDRMTPPALQTSPRSPLIARLRSLARSIFTRRRVETDIDAEIRFHIESRTEDLIASGIAPRQAARQARIEFGPIASHKHAIRDSLGLHAPGLRWFAELCADTLYAARILARSPGFTAIAVASLALAIGANTAIFSYANRMLFARIGLPQPTQLRMLILSADEHLAIHDSWGKMTPPVNGRFSLNMFSYPVYRRLAHQGAVLNDIVAFKDIPGINITAEGNAQVGIAEVVSGNFYSQMQLRPELGRPIQPSDDTTPGTGQVAILSDAFWHRAFGASPAVLGKVLFVNTIPITIIGVNPPRFTGMALASPRVPDIFVPLSMISVLHPGHGYSDPVGPDEYYLNLVARAIPGIPAAKAESALNVQLNAAMRSTLTVKKGETIPIVQLIDGSHGDNFGLDGVAKPIFILMGLASLVLLLACANLANLMLARATFRQREMGVRLALGASRGRIIRQLLTESLLIATLGGTAGIILGFLGRNLIPWLTSNGWEGGAISIPFDWRVFAFAAGVTLLVGLLFGLAPAWRATRAGVSTSLKEGNKSATRRSRYWSGRLLVGLQIMLSTVLVMSSALFLRTILNLTAIDPGFRAKGLTLFSLTAPGTAYPPPKDITLYHQVEQAVAAVPGVQGVSVSSIPLVAGWISQSDFHVEGTPVQKKFNSDDPRDSTSYAKVGTNFFSVMQIPILAGRGFNAQDTATSVHVGIINKALADRYFPHTNPIGRRYSIGGDDEATKWVEIVGICANTHYQNLKDENPMLHFEPYLQSKELGDATYIVRSTLPQAALIPALRRTVARIDPNLPINDIRTQQQQIDETMQDERLFAAMSVSFGLLALTLACVGVYGIMAYTVSQRTNEIGIRLALGAGRGQVRSMVLREAVWIALAGVLVGLAATLALVRLVAAMLYGLKPYDPVSLTAAALILLGMALVASWVPAARASRIDPMEALRHE